MNNILQTLGLFIRKNCNPLKSVKSKFIFKTMAGQLDLKLFLWLTLSHFIVTAAGLKIAGESFVDQPIMLVYWYVATVSTVGYGDVSPVTDIGMLLTTYFVIPVGIVLFSVLVGEVISKYVAINLDLKKGRISFMNSQDHVVIFGNPIHAIKLIEQLRLEESGKGKEVALVALNPDDYQELPKDTYLVAVNSFLEETEINRLAILDASSVLVDTGDDGNNIAVCVMLQHLLDKCDRVKKPNVIAFFEDIQKERIVEGSCKSIECLTVVRNAILARAITDIGAIKINEAINCPEAGTATQYSSQLPEYPLSKATYGFVKEKLESRFCITLLGVEVFAATGRREALLNPPLDYEVTPSQRFFYLSDKRLSDNDLADALSEEVTTA